ncbi:MAG TPA: nitroreductase family protein [Acidimicrobiales bacterium]
MEFQDVISRRKMCRSFADRPVPGHLLDRVVNNGSRAPSAGFTQGWAFVVLEGRDQTDLFWSLASEPEWRAQPDWPGLLRAPVIVLPFAHKQAYLDRYAEPDKASTGMSDEHRWPVPYWLVDTSFAVMAILLTAVDAGLGALFFGLDHGEAELLTALRVPSSYKPIGAIALGYPDGNDRPSPSLARGHRADVIHRGHWH